jgi:hypothetical protein
MKTAYVTLAASLLAIVAAVTAIMMRSGPDEGATDDLGSLEARLSSIEAKLDTATESLVEARADAKQMRASLQGLREDAARLDRTVAELARAQATLNARRAPPPIKVGVKFHDTFEEGTCGWVVFRFGPMVIGAVAQSTEEGDAKEGRGALALSYTLKANSLPIMVRSASPINRLALWARTVDRSAEVHVGVHERDNSNYGTIIHLEPAEGWRRLEIDLATMVLDDHSHDENDRLDCHQIDGVGIADVSAFMGGLGPNVLLIDEVVGEYVEAPPAAQVEEKENF